MTRRAASGKNALQGESRPRLAGFLQPQLADTSPGENLAAAEAVGEELLPAGLVLEQIEGPDAGLLQEPDRD